MHLVNSLVTIFLIHVSFAFGQLYRDDECTLENGETGICRLIKQCSEALAGLKKGVIPKTCGFEGTKIIVCCPRPKLPRRPTKSMTISTTVSTTVSTTTSTMVSQVLNSRVPGVISNKKCVEYAEYAWTQKLNPIMLFQGGPIRRLQCPFKSQQQLVVGGSRATRKEFPHMAQFGYDASNGLFWTCGGSLISERFVLTAAHCLSDRSLGDAKYVRMGIVDLEDTNRIQQFNISETFYHPDYQEPSHYNDIGLVKLNKNAVLSSWVRPACLYTKKESPWTNVIACGWGKTHFGGKESGHLLKVILELYDQTSCNKTYKQEYGTEKLLLGIKDDLMICAGHSKELRDTCQGDSGGPLQVYKDDPNITCMYDVVGVTSYGIACGIDVDIPAVYTRVSHYIKWIEDIVWPPK